MKASMARFAGIVAAWIAVLVLLFSAVSRTRECERHGGMINQADGQCVRADRIPID